MDVRARMQQLMDEREWTIYRLAKEADIPWSTIRNMFKRGTEPSLATLESLCKAFGVTLAQFFDAENEMGLSGEQRRLLQQWSRLQDRDRRTVQQLMESLSEKNRR